MQSWLDLIFLRLFGFKRGHRTTLTLCVPFRVARGGRLLNRDLRRRWSLGRIRGPLLLLWILVGSWWVFYGQSRTHRSRPTCARFWSLANSGGLGWADYLLMSVRGLCQRRDLTCCQRTSRMTSIELLIVSIFKVLDDGLK